MKKLLLVIVPAVLLLTSCMKGVDDHTPDPVEFQFYNSFNLFSNHARLLVAVTEEYIDKYEKDGDVLGMTVVNNENGTSTVTIDFDLAEASNYKFFQGKLVTTLSSSTITNKGTSRVIDLSDLRYHDGYTYRYKGKISIEDNGMGNSNTRIEEIVLSNFSFGKDSEEYFTMNYSYTYELIGISTPGDVKDDTYTWSNGTGSGSNLGFGEFEVTIDSKIEKKGALNFTSQGKYSFYVPKIGALSFTAEYGKGGEGMITITSADGLKQYTYNQYKGF